jgi:hypothetical protein
MTPSGNSELLIMEGVAINMLFGIWICSPFTLHVNHTFTHGVNDGHF